MGEEALKYGKGDPQEQLSNTSPNNHNVTHCLVYKVPSTHPAIFQQSKTYHISAKKCRYLISFKRVPQNTCVVCSVKMTLI